MRAVALVATVLFAGCDGLDLSVGAIVPPPDDGVIVPSSAGDPPAPGEIVDADAPRTWGRPAAVSSTTYGLNSQSLVVAVDPDGTLTAAWVQDDGRGWDIIAARYEITSGWSPAKIIAETGLDTNDGTLAPRVRLSADLFGQATVVWDQYDGARHVIRARRFVSGEWEPEISTLSTDGDDATEPQIASDRLGDVTVVWTQRTSGLRGIWVSRFTSSLGWSPGQNINEGPDEAVHPALAVSPTKVFVVWEQGTLTRTDIWSSVFEVDDWSVPALVEHDNAGSAADPIVVADSHGIATVVWSHFDGTLWNARASRSDHDIWGPAALLETKIGNVQRMNLVVDGQGDVTALWNQSDGPWTEYRGWASRFADGAWLVPEKIGDLTGTHIDSSADQEGNVFAVWASPGLMNQYVPGVGWGLAAPIGDDMRNTWYPRIVTDLSDRTTVMWMHRENFVTTVWAKVLE